MARIRLELGEVEYRVLGPAEHEAPTVVFVHGFLVAGSLWDRAAALVAERGVRCIVPDWPLGSHRVPARPGAELSPRAVGRAVLELCEALDLRDVILVGNDTGGAICQLALQGDTTRVAGLVLTNCDAFEAFPPRFFVPLFRLARHRRLVGALLQPTRFRLSRHGPLAYGRLLRRPRNPQLTRGWVAPALGDPRIRNDIVRFARGLEGTELVDAATWLCHFDKPATILWGTKDRCFTADLAARLATALPCSELVECGEATTLVPVDRPVAVADAILATLRRTGRACTMPSVRPESSEPLVAEQARHGPSHRTRA